MKFLFLAFCCTLPLLPLSAQEQYMKSVVRITAQLEGIGEETGAGILVGKEGTKYYIVTARHVVHGSEDIAVQVHGDKAKYKATVLHQDEEMDTAVLVFTPEKTPVLRELIPADAEIITQGRKVQSIGHPGGSYWLPNLLNLVQQTSLYEDERSFSITPQAVIGGCSGGPVFIETGGWLGMITETSAVQAKCLKADAIRHWLKQLKVPLDCIYFPFPEMEFIKGGQVRVIPPLFADVCDSIPSNVPSFSIGKYEVTIKDFAAFVMATGYVTSVEKEYYVKSMRLFKGRAHSESSDGQSKYFDTVSWGFVEKGVNWRHDEFGEIRPYEQYNYPVTYVTEGDAWEYCKWLSKKTGVTYRLPKQEEWAYVFLPSSEMPLPDEAILGNLLDSSWNGPNQNSFETDYKDGFQFIAPVGSFVPNVWRLHDIYGNVSEHCEGKRPHCQKPRWSAYYYVNNSLEWTIRPPIGFIETGVWEHDKGWDWVTYDGGFRVASD